MRTIFLIVLLLAAPVYAQEAANDQCKAGNYAFDWRTTTPPCAGADEAQKCRLNAPCYEYTGGVRTVIGVCVAEKKCLGTMVRVCDATTGACAWQPPARAQEPPPPYVDPSRLPNLAQAPDVPVVPGMLRPQESLLENLYRSFGDNTDFADLQKELSELDMSVRPGSQDRSMDRAGFLSNLLREDRFSILGDRPLIPREDVIDAGKELAPRGEGVPGTTFAQLGGDVPVDLRAQFERDQLASSLERWVMLGRQEIAETWRNWFATRLESPWTELRAPSLEPELPLIETRYSFESISDLVSGAVKCATGFGCPQPLPPADPVGELQPLMLLPKMADIYEPAPLSLLPKLADTFDTLEPLSLLPIRSDMFDALPPLSLLPQQLQPVETLRNGIERYFSAGGPLGVMDDQGRLWGFQEPETETVIRIDSEEGERIARVIGCTGSCYETAVAEALSAIPKTPAQIPEAEPAPVPTPERLEPPRTQPQPEPTPRVQPALPMPTQPAPMQPTAPQSSNPLSGFTMPQFAFPYLHNIIPTLLALLSNLAQWWNSTPQSEVIPPVVSMLAEPPRISKNASTTISWSSANWKNISNVRCTISGLGISLATSGASGRVQSPVLVTTSDFKTACSDGTGAQAEKVITVIVD